MLSAAAAAQREPPRRKESGRGAEIGHGHVCADEQEGEKTTKSAAQESINPQRGACPCCRTSRAGLRTSGVVLAATSEHLWVPYWAGLL